MSSLISAIDRTAAVKFGENCHLEYALNVGNVRDDNIRERIVQFSFQLTRTKSDHQLNQLEITLHSLLTELHNAMKRSTTNGTTTECIVMLYKMIGHTRDIVDGKGEYSLTYMMIYVWDKFWPLLAQHAIYTCVHSDDTLADECEGEGESACQKEEKEKENNGPHPFGSWKDIKYLCAYLKSKSHDVTYSPLINYCIQLLNEQLDKDDYNYRFSLGSLSMAAKWAPREKSPRFGWLFSELARAYFYIYECTANDNHSKIKAILKCKTDYRKLLANLNRAIDTVQIKQCANSWKDINPATQTSITMHKQKNAFLNKTKKGDIRHPELKDRTECAQHFETYIEKAVKGEVVVKGKRIGLENFTKQALEYIHANNDDNKMASQIALLNAQWRDNSSQTGSLRNMVPMVDVSGSMGGDPLHCAIALGIRVAEKSLIGKRVMTFSAVPTWVNLDTCTNFVDCVKKVREANWGMNTNFYAALDLILDAIVLAKLPASDVEDMILAIFSDMQIDAASTGSDKTMMEMIEQKYYNAGIKICGTPYKTPHILFWNLRSTDGAPALYTNKNTSMMSGFSPALLNSFCEDGLPSLYSCTPYEMLKSQLDNSRYLCLQKECMRVLNNMNVSESLPPGNGWC